MKYYPIFNVTSHYSYILVAGLILLKQSKTILYQKQM